MTNCDCSTWSYYDPTDDGERKTTGCTEQVSSGKFAPGHGNKLRDLFISAGVLDADVVHEQPGFLDRMTVEQATAIHRFGFDWTVSREIERRKAAAAMAELLETVALLQAAQSGGKAVAIMLLQRLGGHVVITRDEVSRFDPATRLHNHQDSDTGDVELYLESTLTDTERDELRNLLTGMTPDRSDQ